MLVSAATAHAAARPARIAVVDDASRVALRGGISPRATASRNLGAAPADQTLTMSIRFSLTDTQQAGLTKLLADQQNPASASYHQWLTPEQFNAQFGLAASDVAKVGAWLQSQGFTVTETSRGGQFVRFTGTVAQANQAFQTQIERVSLNGVEHIANLKAATLPSAIAAVTTAVTGLHDFTLRPQHVRSTFTPKYTSGTGAHYLTPMDLYTIYDVNGLLSSSINGSGVTIAVVGQSDVQVSDVTAFRAAAGLSVNNPTVKLYGADPVSAKPIYVAEASLDLEYAGALAPSAAVLYVTSTDVVDGSITETIDNNLAAVLSNSYGDCEADINVTDLAYYNGLMQQAAAEGITIISPGGDSGATDCDVSAPATHGLAVDFPASSPWVTGVGGTTFAEGSGGYWSSTNGTGGASATGYIPETTWNDSSSGAISGGGGGASLVFPKPSWQTGTGVPSDASRDVPDVSVSADPNHDPYIFCYSGSCTSGFANSSGTLQLIGGTSAGAPVFAGLMALVVQKQGARVGVANPTIYALATSGYSANVFHDVTSGNNNQPCTAGSTDCPTGPTIGYSAGVGYDQATGWGSVDAMNLVNDWALVTPLAVTPAGLTPTVTNVAGSAVSVAAGTSVTLTATVASGDSTVTAVPTGTIIFTVDSVSVGTGTLSGGTVTFTLPTATLTAGTHKVQATYNGDGTYYGSKGAFVLTVTAASSTNTAADFTLTPHSITLGVSSGSVTQGIVYTVTPINGFTGTVSFDAIYSANVNITKIFSATSVQVGSAAGTTTLSLAAYTGGNLAASAHRRFGWETAGSGVLFAGLWIFLVPSRRRRIPGMLVVFVAVCSLVAMSGCANNGSATTATAAQTNAAAGTYPITVTASSTVGGTVVTHTATISLTVQ